MSNRLQNFALVVLAIAVVTAAVFVLRRPDAAGSSTLLPAASPSAASPTPAPLLRAAFLGDSYTSGSDEGGYGEKGYPVVLAKAEGWATPLVAGVGGSGYVNAGTDKPFGDRVGRIIDYLPDVVIVFGSRNDAREPAARIRSAATDVLRRLKAGLPSAKIVVVGPAWFPQNPPPGAPRSDLATVRAVAASVGLPFIDPMGEGWLSAPGIEGKDGVHPNDAGHARIARLLADDLKRMKISA